MLCVSELVRASLAEDMGSGDITCQATINNGHISFAQIITKESGILAGCDLVQEVFQQIDPELSLEFYKRDGARLYAQDIVLSLKGKTASILKGERVALNFMQNLSGIASRTKHLTELLSGSQIKLLDTRKTTPLHRAIQKKAVLLGGGVNHRFGLYDMYLIKENHIRACGSITKAVALCKAKADGKKVEVEVTNLQEVNEALKTQADIIMLDNMDNAQILEAALLIREHSEKKIEVSGNMDEKRIRELKDYPIDYISMGALTHSIKALDLSLLILREENHVR
jgi:nicotinate-nucleotide pyrophosphorylase (carboxylating)